MKKILTIISIIALLLSNVCYAEEVHFDIKRVDSTGMEYFYDLEYMAISSRNDNYIWSQEIDIPLIEKMPEPNIIGLGNSIDGINGYLTEINGVVYWEGRVKMSYAPNGRMLGPMTLPVVPMEKGVTEITEDISLDWYPDLFPYNAQDKIYLWENVSSKWDKPVFQASGHIAKWTFDYDLNRKKCNIFVNGIYRLQTDIPFNVYGRTYRTGSYDNVLYWEDEDTFYIKNYNLLLSTPKQPLYDALDALEELPVIKVNDTILGFETPPVVEADRTLVPMRFLFEQLGADVEWDEASESATAINEKNSVTFAIDNKTAKVNGKAAVMDVPARLINDKTMVPLRFLSEELGYTVEWDEDTRVATVITE